MPTCKWHSKYVGSCLDHTRLSSKHPMPISRDLSFLLGLLAILCSRQVLACYELTEGTATASERLLLGGNFSQVLKCTGVSSFLIVPYLWRPISITVDCGKLQPFHVYVGPSPDALIKRHQGGERAWCSLSSLFKSGCQLQLSPFSTSYVGVRKTLNTGVACRFTRDDGMSSFMLGSGLAGAVVFALAGPLSESIALRVTSGGLLFALGSVIILIYIAARQMPGRRSMVTTAMMLGSSSWGLMRWLTGYWLPSTYALLHNRYLLAYLAAASLLGAGVTYLYGGVENTKLNTLMRVGLQLLGLLLLYTGTWTLPPVFATLVGVMMANWLVRRAEPILARLRQRATSRLIRDDAPATSVPAVAAAAPEQETVGTPMGPGPSGGSRLAQLQPLSYNGEHVEATLQSPHTPMQQAYVPVGPAGAVQELAAAVSDLVRAGNIINPLTGHTIRIGGDKFNQLVEQGFTPDMTAGRLQPPPATPGSAGSPEAENGIPAWRRLRRRSRNV